MFVLIRKYNETICGTNKKLSFIQAWDWILKYSKTKFIILNKNTQNFIAKTDINWLKNGFSMKLIKIQFLEVPLCWFMRKEDILSFRGFYLEGVWLELLSKVVFELKIKQQSGFQESPRFHQRIVHLQSPLPGTQSHVTFSNSFLHIVPA